MRLRTSFVEKYTQNLGAAIGRQGRALAQIIGATLSTKKLTTVNGKAKYNRIKPESCLCQVLNFKLGCFAAIQALLGIHTPTPRLEN